MISVFSFIYITLTTTEKQFPTESANHTALLRCSSARDGLAKGPKALDFPERYSEHTSLSRTGQRSSASGATWTSPRSPRQAKGPSREVGPGTLPWAARSETVTRFFAPPPTKSSLIPLRLLRVFLLPVRPDRLRTTVLLLGIRRTMGMKISVNNHAVKLDDLDKSPAQKNHSGAS